MIVIMKKSFTIAVAILATIVSCSKTENVTSEKIHGFTMGAELEQTSPANKADLNNSLQTLWATGDKIGIHIQNGVNDWSTDQMFTLASGNGTTSGTFHCDEEYNESDHWDTFAFFPFSYVSSGGSTDTGSNVGGDQKMYFNMPNAYYEYTSGKSFLPLLANLGESGVKHPTSASFKYVGGAVVLNLTKVPGAAKSLGMSIDGVKINGWQNGVAQNTVGSASGIITGGDGDNTTWLNFDSSGSEDRNFKFVFPVPTISSTSNITFTMFDKNDIKIWQKTASSQPAIGRAQALVMPDKAVSPIPQNMYLVGYWNGADQNTGVAFSNSTGKVSLSHSGDGYVCLRAADTDNWYMTDAYVGSGNTATMKCQSGNKLYVPDGTQTFTMTYNSDGSITISYE